MKHILFIMTLLLTLLALEVGTDAQDRTRRRISAYVAPPLVVTDDFNRADGTNLGANWTDKTGGCSIATNQAKGDAGSDNFSYYSSTAFNRDHYSQVTLGNPAGDSGPMVRIGATTGYEVYRSGTGWRIYGSGVSYQSLDAPCTTGVVLRLEVSGAAAATQLVLKCNGSTIATTTDNTGIETGGPGIYIYGTTPRVDAWEGGNL